MRLHHRVIRLLVALSLLLLIIAFSGVGATPAPAAATSCVYLPLVGRLAGGGQAPVQSQGATGGLGCPNAPAPAPDPPTATATATATATTAPPSPPKIAGTVRLVPEYQVIPTTQQPHRYMLVLDASGSMSANFNGQCNNAGLVQCANGPPGYPGVTISGTGPSYWWTNQTERRIYVAKKALARLVDLTNMQGNAGYTTVLPPDQAGVVWFNDTVPTSNTLSMLSTPATIKTFINNANQTGGDVYRSSGGTNGAAGLYRAAQMLAAAPPTVDYNGQTYTYENDVIFVTDGVSNQFLDTSVANLSGGISSSATYPAGSSCRGLGSLVTENAPCQTTDIGGAYNGWDRPISQMSVVSANNLRNSTVRASVFVIALSSIPNTGLMDGVASSSNSFFSAVSLMTYPNGTTNVDGIIDTINAKVTAGICVPGPNGASTDVILPDQFVNSVPGLTYPTVGQVAIYNSTTQLTAPIIAGQGGTLSYAFADVPQGTYVLQAFLYYHHPLDQPAVMRQYSRIWYGEQALSTLTVDVGPANQQLDQPLTLKLNGDVCAP
jgi:hypothetical protein